MGKNNGSTKSATVLNRFSEFEYINNDVLNRQLRVQASSSVAALELHSCELNPLRASIYIF